LRVTVEENVELTVLTVPDCPHRDLLEQRLEQALAGRQATIVRREIRDADDARRYGLRGSPTLLIDGTDPFAADGGPAALACRLYRSPDGRVEGAPSVQQLRAALDAPRDACFGPAGCAPRSLWGWSPPPSVADTRLKRAADRLLPRTGWPLLVYYAVVIALLNLAAHLPIRGALAVDAVAALAAGGWCAVNFWRCQHAHCLVTGAGWLALTLFVASEAALGRSLIGGDEQIVFLAILGLALIFEAGWYAVHRTNTV
jgi:hypothetical protein